MDFFIAEFGYLRTKKGVHLVPDNWDDFGFKTLYTVFYFDGVEDIKLGYVKVGMKNLEYGRAKIPINFNILPDDMFSLGLSEDYYREVKKLGSNLREEIHIGLKDIAFSEELFNKYKNELVTKKSLFRDSYANQIKNQFRRIAHGGEILTEYNFEHRINNNEKRNNTLIFNVKPESMPPTNIPAIIGSHGSGKTTTLKAILKDYLYNNEELDTDFTNSIFVSFSMFDRSDELFKKIKNNTIAFSYIGACKPDGNIKSHKEIVTEFTSTINDLMRSKKLDILASSIKLLEEDDNLADYEISNYIFTYLDPEIIIEKGEFKNTLASIFSDCSSGHQITLLTVVKLIHLITEKTLIIFDEPETHLHPPLLSAFIRTISSLSISANAMAILSTHSPVVLQEIPTSCISIIKKVGGERAIISPRLNTFGENIGVLTEEVFGLEIKQTGFHSLLKSVAVKYNNYEEALERFDEEISMDAKAVLRSYYNNKREF